MPTIPRANPDGLSPTAPLPGVRVSTNAPAGAFGGQPRSVDLSGVERATAQIVEQERAKADQIAALDADNKLADLETSLLYDQKTGILNRKGQNAFTAPEEVSAAWRKGTAEIEKGLSTDRQLALFQAHAQGRFQNVFSTVQRHVAGERQQYDNETATAAIANRYDAAVRSNGDPRAVESALLETQAIIGDYARRNGWSPEVAAERKATAASRIHAGVIDTMLSQGRDLDAQAYFEKNGKAIDGEQLPQIERSLEEGSVRGESQRQADAIVAKANGMPAALELVRKIADPKVRDATDQRVRQYFTEQKTAAEERRQSNFQSATNLVERSRSVDAVPPALWSTFTVGERSELRNYAEKLVKGEPVQTDWSRYYDLMSMASSETTKDQFLKTNLLLDRSRLSDTDFKQLTDLQASLRKSDGKADEQLGGYRTANEVVEQSLREAGYDPTKAKPGSDEIKKIALFRRSVDLQVQALEANTKKKATGEDVQRIVDNLLVKGTVVGTAGRFSSGTQKSVFDRLPGERLVIKVTDIPPRERALIETTLRQNRLPVSDAAVLKLYVRKLGQSPTLNQPPDE